MLTRCFAAKVIAFNSIKAGSLKKPVNFCARNFNKTGVLHEMDLKTVLSKLDQMYPVKLAEKWDNVGLLVEPTKPRDITKMILTIDLSEKVLEEALENKADFILSYHPPIFSALKRLNVKNTKDRIILRAIEEKIAVYSPHTSVDSMRGGVNDWLASGLGEANVEILQPAMQDNNNLRVIVHIQEKLLESLQNKLSEEGIGFTESSISFRTSETQLSGTNAVSNGNTARVELLCPKSKLGKLSELITSVHGESKANWEAHSLEPIPHHGIGQGRLITLKQKVSLQELVSRIKNHLGMKQVRIAFGNNTNMDTMVQSIALCAGAGGEVISKVKADVYWTGEMRHHDVLDANYKGTTCILCEHTNTERGYLVEMKKKLDVVFSGKVDVFVAKSDADPLVIV